MKYELLQMRKQDDGGAIVNNSSIGGLIGIPGRAIYNATKHGVLGLTKSAALEYAARGIRINAICPGTIETPMVANMLANEPDAMKEILRDQPIGRLGRPEDRLGCAVALQPRRGLRNWTRAHCRWWIYGTLDFRGMSAEEEKDMPHVIVKLWPGKSEQQKARLAEKITEDIMNVFNYGEESISVGFEEISSSDWKDKVYKPDIQQKWDKLYKKPGYEL